MTVEYPRRNGKRGSLVRAMSVLKRSWEKERDPATATCEVRSMKGVLMHEKVYHRPFERFDESFYGLWERSMAFRVFAVAMAALVGTGIGPALLYGAVMGVG